MIMPKYTQAVCLSKELKKGTAESSGKWSDRDNNSIYASPRKTISPVHSVHGGIFEVYDAKKTSDGDIFLKIKSLSSSLVKKDGWIPMEKTLVSSKAMATETRIDQEIHDSGSC